jgi:hypothetical protein
MMTWLRYLLVGKKAARPPGRVRLELEALEDRLTPTITYHGGNLLPHVEVQALYLGSDWSTNATYNQQTRSLDGFLKNLVAGPYMDMLSTAGYGVGRGSAVAGKIAALQLNKNSALSDGAIQVDLQGFISNGTLQAPDANRLYVVFVEDNVLVRTSDGLISRTDFLGYHGAFAGLDAHGNASDIRYAVVAYPGGNISNAAVTGLSALNDMTEVASHEIAEAVTDPDVNYSALGWYDDALNDEIADVVNQRYVLLNGFAVQRVGDKNDQAMTPAGAAALQPVSFALLTNGSLYEHTAAGWTFLRKGVASLSAQGIDNSGRATVDAVFSTGQAYEYHHGSGWVFLHSGVKWACAGQGVSYLLLNNGSLLEYHDIDGTWSRTLAVGVSTIDAGTDRYGVNMVDAVFSSGTFSEYSDTSGWHALCGDSRSVSAGALGVSVVLLKNGRAYQYNEATAGWTYLAGSIAEVAAGTDVSGALIELLGTNGTLSQYRPRIGTNTLATGVKSVGTPRAGLVDVVLTNGDAYEHTATGWTALCGTAKQAA